MTLWQEKIGLQPADLLEVLSSHPLNNPVIADKGALMIASSFGAHFPLKHAEKDMRIATDMGLRACIDYLFTESIA